MDKRILAALALVAVSGSAAAASICTGVAANGATIDGATDGSAFVRVTFTPKCSANVQLDFTQTATGAGVCANSKKGKNNFKGTTAGGGIGVDTTCTLDSNSQCTAVSGTLDATTNAITCS
ncbi:hypothetical protein dqs_3493 [Azoarcus olearius]|uniref:hypothetical protein n=1 Tax=Azoarcus sp. (strain BH72) TaxID=418699 RepID=UPI00080609B0|nr:hypothetical protein [Azoarcus olearius]ANQ86514.1 hypothetical protein dqs_3493 [Azoarcus olearius]